MPFQPLVQQAVPILPGQPVLESSRGPQSAANSIPVVLAPSQILSVAGTVNGILGVTSVDVFHVFVDNPTPISGIVITGASFDVKIDGSFGVTAASPFGITGTVNGLLGVTAASPFGITGTVNGLLGVTAASPFGITGTVNGLLGVTAASPFGITGTVNGLLGVTAASPFGITGTVNGLLGVTAASPFGITGTVNGLLGVTAASPFGITGTVNGLLGVTAASPFGITGTVNGLLGVTAASPFGITGTVNGLLGVTAASPFGITGTVNGLLGVTAASPFGITGTVNGLLGVTAASPFGITGTVNGLLGVTAASPFGITGTVNGLLGVTGTVNGVMGVTAASPFGITGTVNGIVGVTAASPFTVNGIVGVTAASPFTVNGIVGVTAASPLVVNGIVGVTASSPLDVNGIVGVTAASPFTVNGIVGVTAASALAVNGIVGVTAASPLAVNGIVGVTAASPLDVNGIVGVTAASPFGITGTVNGIVGVTAASPLAVNGIVGVTAASPFGITGTVNGIVGVTAASPFTVNGIVGTTGVLTVSAPASAPLNIQLLSPLTAYGDLDVAALTPTVQSDFQYGFDSRTWASLAISGATTLSPTYTSVVNCSTGTTISGIAQCASRVMLSYKPGLGVASRMSAFFTAPVADSYQLAGFINPENGYAVGYNGTSFGFLRRYGGQQEVRTAEITASASETVTVTLNGYSRTVVLTSGSNLTNASAQLGGVDYTGLDYMGWNGYQQDGAAHTVRFQARQNCAPRSGLFSISGPVTRATFTTNVAGVLPTEVWYPQASWNVDPFNGSGPSGMTLVPTNGNTYQIQYQYLGFGAITLSIGTPSGLFQAAHVIQYANSFTTPSIICASAPLVWQAQSVGSTTNLTVGGAGASGFIQGPVALLGPRHSAASTTKLINASNIPLITLRNNFVAPSTKTCWNSVILTSMSIAVRNFNGTMVIGVIRNATTNGNASFTPVENGRSLLSYDTSSTLAVGTDVDFRFILADTIAGSVIDLTNQNILIPPGETLSVIALSTTDTTNATTCSISWVENI
jgi:hypothetical protein